jgi:excisionase family DNA binding protein
MPQTLKSATRGRIRASQFYTVGQVAVLLGLAHSTVIRMIDQGKLPAFRMPTRRRDRRVFHQTLVGFVQSNPAFRYALERIDGFDAGADFPEVAEPPARSTHTVLSASPRSAHRPRTVKGGKIPVAPTYSASEVGFVLGLSRRSVISKLDRGILLGFRVPATGLTSWTWRIPRGWLAKFLRDNPAYSFAWNRIRGCELRGDDHGS